MLLGGCFDTFTKSFARLVYFHLSITHPRRSIQNTDSTQYKFFCFRSWTLIIFHRAQHSPTRLVWYADSVTICPQYKKAVTNIL